MASVTHKLLSNFAAAAALAGIVAQQGCAAIPLAAVVGPVLDAGGGVLLKTGTEYTASGTAYRTFTLPLHDVHAGVLEAFRRTQVTIKQDEVSAKDEQVVGLLQHRVVYVRLTPLTPVLTSMELAVKRNLLASDKATTSELLAQTESVLADPTLRTHVRKQQAWALP
jgi:hypothetical protein